MTDPSTPLPTVTLSIPRSLRPTYDHGGRIPDEEMLHCVQHDGCRLGVTGVQARHDVRNIAYGVKGIIIAGMHTLEG